MLLLFSSSGDGWSILLADGDTGWHIRTGEHILATKAVPTTDSFSFTKTGDAWYAWEWAADVIFAAVHQYAGLRGLVFLSGTALCLSGVILFRYMLWRGAAVHVAVVISILVMEAAKIHFLARPHLFTLLLIPITMWMIDRDVQHPTRITWPIAALWTNLHGGFLILLTTLIIFTSVFGVLAFFTEGELQKTRFRRFAWLSIACTLATFVNPYGYTLYTHIIPYLQSDWIKNMIQEFQSPQFRSESLRKFEFLLFLGLGLVPALFRRGSAPFAMLILAWAHVGSPRTRVRFHLGRTYCNRAHPPVEPLDDPLHTDLGGRHCTGSFQECTDSRPKNKYLGASVLGLCVCLHICPELAYRFSRCKVPSTLDGET
jgi:hypothetical protein